MHLFVNEFMLVEPGFLPLLACPQMVWKLMSYQWVLQILPDLSTSLEEV